MTVLICPVRPGDNNEELRYAIRSWEANLDLPGGLQIWTVGHRPAWLQPDKHVEGNKYKSVPLAVFDNVYLGAQTAHEAQIDEVMFMNDDFFCLDPVGKILPVRRNESLSSQCRQFPQGAGLWWPRSLVLTLNWLREQGHREPHSYETHRPLVVNPALMVESLEKWLATPDAMTGDVPQWRTIYGVLNNVKAWPVKDAKLGVNSSGVGTPWVSTSDESWRRYGRSMMNRFQKPSRWER